MVVAEYVVPADGSLALVDELNAAEASNPFFAHAGTRVPPNTPRPAEFVVVLPVGGVERDPVTDSPMLVIEAYSADEGRAERICAFAVAVAQAAARAGYLGGVPCYRVRVVALPQNLPRESVPDRVRFSATVIADLRRSSVVSQ